MTPADLPDREGAANQLRAIIERIERINEEIADLNRERREIRVEAKSNGFDVPTITQMIARRRKEPQAVLAADLLLETYEQAVGYGAAGVGMLQASRCEDGTFHIAMVAGPQPDAAVKLTKATKARKEAVALAELARRAREV